MSRAAAVDSYRRHCRIVRDCLVRRLPAKLVAFRENVSVQWVRAEIRVVKHRRRFLFSS